MSYSSAALSILGEFYFQQKFGEDVHGFVGSGDSVRFGSTSYKYALERGQVFCFVISIVKNGLLITCFLHQDQSALFAHYVPVN